MKTTNNRIWIYMLFNPTTADKNNIYYIKSLKAVFNEGYISQDFYNYCINRINNM